MNSGLQWRKTTAQEGKTWQPGLLFWKMVWGWIWKSLDRVSFREEGYSMYRVRRWKRHKNQQRAVSTQGCLKLKTVTEIRWTRTCNTFNAPFPRTASTDYQPTFPPISAIAGYTTASKIDSLPSVFHQCMKGRGAGTGCILMLDLPIMRLSYSFVTNCGRDGRMGGTTCSMLFPSNTNFWVSAV